MKHPICYVCDSGYDGRTLMRVNCEYVIEHGKYITVTATSLKNLRNNSKNVNKSM